MAAPTPADTEEIPLQAISSKKDEAPTPEPAPAPAPAPKKIGLLIGPKLGGQFGVAGPLTGSVLVGVEVGYRLPVARRIPGLSLELTFANPGARRDTVLGTERTASLWISIPLYASASFDLGPGVLRFLAGPAFEWWRARATLSGSAFSFDDVVWAVGAAGLISYGFNLGAGALAVELRYRFGLPRIAGEETNAHSIGISAAYVFNL